MKVEGRIRALKCVEALAEQGFDPYEDCEEFFLQVRLYADDEGLVDLAEEVKSLVEDVKDILGDMAS